jgi:hypothetical protein
MSLVGADGTTLPHGLTAGTTLYYAASAGTANGSVGSAGLFTARLDLGREIRLAV